MLTRLFGTVFILFLTVATPSLAKAELSIAVVDTRVLLSESDASKDVSKQLASHREDVLKELAKKEKDLISEQNKVVEAKKNLSEDDFIKKAKAFEENKRAFQKLSIDLNEKFNRAAAEAESSLKIKVVEIVQSIAAAKNYDLVITKQNVIVGAKSIDLTEEAMARLNKEVPSYKVKFKK